MITALGQRMFKNRNCGPHSSEASNLTGRITLEFVPLPHLVSSVLASIIKNNGAVRVRCLLYWM